MSPHLRLDDSRPRGLASECVCGLPDCTLWYDDAQLVASGAPRWRAKRSKVRCPYCGRLFDQADIEQHIKDEHQ